MGDLQEVSPAQEIDLEELHEEVSLVFLRRQDPEGGVEEKCPEGE